MPESPSSAVQQLLGSARVVVFMKGTRAAPACGFSAQMVQVLQHLTDEFTCVDVGKDDDLRSAVKRFSQWPTFPQLYVDGEFLGGVDLAKSQLVSGELATRLGVAPAQTPTPELRVSHAALKALVSMAGGQAVRIELDALSQPSLSIAEGQASDISVDIEDVTVVMDVLTAARADGLCIDYLEDPGGFVLTPRRAQAVVGPEQLERLLDQEALRLIDCRTLAEFQRGTLDGAEHLTQPLLTSLLEESTQHAKLLFFCQDGRRARNVAEHFVAGRFEHVMFLEGGLQRLRETALGPEDGSPAGPAGNASVGSH